MSANENKDKKIIKPNIIGASILFGIIIGASVSGFLGKFEIWVPFFGTIGIILGLYLWNNEAKQINKKRPKAQL